MENSHNLCVRNRQTDARSAPQGCQRSETTNFLVSVSEESPARATLSWVLHRSPLSLHRTRASQSEATRSTCTVVKREGVSMSTPRQPEAVSQQLLRDSATKVLWVPTHLHVWQRESLARAALSRSRNGSHSQRRPARCRRFSMYSFIPKRGHALHHS